jgi:hypothetical protein
MDGTAAGRFRHGIHQFVKPFRQRADGLVAANRLIQRDGFIAQDRHPLLVAALIALTKRKRNSETGDAAISQGDLSRNYG